MFLCSAKIVLHLDVSPVSSNQTRPVATSQTNVIKLSFKEGGQKEVRSSNSSVGQYVCVNPPPYQTDVI